MTCSCKKGGLKMKELTKDEEDALLMKRASMLTADEVFLRAEIVRRRGQVMRPASRPKPWEEEPGIQHSLGATVEKADTGEYYLSCSSLGRVELVPELLEQLIQNYGEIDELAILAKVQT